MAQDAPIGCSAYDCGMALILSIDGGGVRGVFAARLIARLDAERPGWRDGVGLYAGTSTGSIIAACLADGMAASEIVTLYQQHVETIFDDSWWDDLTDLGKAAGADYSLKGLRKVLTGLFGERTLRSLAGKVLIPSVQLDGEVTIGGKRVRRFKPKFFHNFKGSDSDGSEMVVDVVCRSCAAPTYFPSEQGFIDGGVVANNPAMCALAQAVSPFGLNTTHDKIRLLSIGTGLDEVYIDAGRSGRLDWGWAQWARPIVSVMMEGASGVADYQCQQMLGDRYERLDAALPRRVRMDDTEAGTLSDLMGWADAVPLTSAVRLIDG